MFFQHAALALVALCSFSDAYFIHNKRAAVSGVGLYAYGDNANGNNANGAPIFYADGLAYMGLKPTAANASVVANITFTTDASDTTVPWSIASNTSSVSFNETLYMYIVPTSGDFTQVGFVANASSGPTGAVTTGFSFFGKAVAYAASESDYEMMFWAANTTDAGIYGLYWNAGSTNIPLGAFPVTVKVTPPTIVSL